VHLFPVQQNPDYKQYKLHEIYDCLQKHFLRKYIAPENHLLLSELLLLYLHNGQNPLSLPKTIQKVQKDVDFSHLSGETHKTYRHGKMAYNLQSMHCLVRKKASSPPPYFNIFVILTFAQTFAFLLYMDITTTVIKNQEGNKKISRHSKSNYKFLSILYKKHSGEILRSVSFYKLHKF